MLLKDRYHMLYASKERNFILNNIFHDSFDLLKRNSIQYPNQDKWYFGTSIPRVINGNGEQIVLLDGDKLIAMMILKLEEEKKLCAIRVDEEYQRKGISHLLFEESFKLLGTDKPLITISESNIDMFESIIKSYDWHQDRIIYPNGETYQEPEYVFNEVSKKRVLTKDNI